MADKNNGDVRNNRTTENEARQVGASNSTDLLYDKHFREKVAKEIWLEIKEIECSNQVAYELADKVILMCFDRLSV